MPRDSARPWPGAAPDFLGRDERLEDAPAHRSSGIPSPVSLIEISTIVADGARAHGDAALGAGAFDHVADGVRGVEHQVQHHLVDVAGVAMHGRNVAEIGLELGDGSCIRCAPC